MIENTFGQPESFFCEEEICGFKVTTERKKIWACELDLLRQLDNICKKHDIVYYLDSGSLIGAVRHKGFIPWDDDIDVIMTRKEYDRFLKIAEKELKTPYVLQTPYNEDYYTRGHAQLRNTNTTALLKYEMFKVTFNQGVFIDIFPMDYVPESLRETGKIFDLTALRSRLYNCYISDGKSGKWWKNILKRIIKKFLTPKVFRNLYRYTENRLLKCKNKSEKISKMLHYGNKICYCTFFPESYLGTPQNVMFQGMTVPIPENYDGVLRAEYIGDYTKPVNRGTSHGTMIADTDNPCDNVIELIRQGSYKIKEY